MENEMKLEYGKVYQLVSDQTEDVYIGSTNLKTLAMRLSKHKNHYKRYLEGKKHYISSFKICKYDDCRIELVCEPKHKMTRKELTQMEGFYINNEENCINNRIAGRSQKQYYKDNREKKLKYHKQWREDNKEVLKVKHNKYYKDVAGVDILCECGCTYKKKHEERHKSSKKHLDIINKVVKETSEERKVKYADRKKVKVECDICHKEMAKGSLFVHKRDVHEKGNDNGRKTNKNAAARVKVECPHCDKGMSKGSLSRHIKMYH
jgi:hypothetical protein